MPIKKLKKQLGKKSLKNLRKKSQLKKENKSNDVYSLPTEKTEPSIKLSDSVILIYGKKKIGKTSLANEFSENMLHLMVEPQARSLRVYQRPCESYEALLEYTRLLKTKVHNFDSVSLDPLPLFYDLTMDYTCEQEGFEHPGGQNDYGLSWSKVKRNFNKAVSPLLRLNTGVIFHAHETEDDIVTREGRSYKIIRPEGGTQVWEFINANIENIWYYHLRGNKRYLQIRGDSYAIACTAWPDRFYTPSGEQVFAVPMGDSPSKGYKNLIRAFNNKQEETYSELEEDKIKKQRRKKLIKKFKK